MRQWNIEETLIFLIADFGPKKIAIEGGIFDFQIKVLVFILSFARVMRWRSEMARAWLAGDVHVRLVMSIEIQEDALF